MAKDNKISGDVVVPESAPESAEVRNLDADAVGVRNLDAPKGAPEAKVVKVFTKSGETRKVEVKEKKKN